MRIGLITTLFTNIGDDFIRDGICRLLLDVYSGKDIQFIYVNKHHPFTAYPRWHPIHVARIAGHSPLVRKYFTDISETIFSKIGMSYFDDCEMIVQCGAPVYWPDCHANEWAGPLWKDIIGRLHEKIPVLNLAAGSCYPWERQPVKIDNPKDALYIRSLLDYCRITTVRDQLSYNICESFGYNVPLIPCTAFLAGMGKVANLNANSPILLNYMSGGGHYDWKQVIDPKKWERTFKDLILRLGKRHKLAFLCHDEKEHRVAAEIDSTIPRLFPRTIQEYFECISDAKYGICNRMHASVGMAGIGLSSIAIGTDTRLLMVSQLGLKTHYVKDVGADMLEEEIEMSLKFLPDEQERLLSLQQETRRKYLNILHEVLAI
jgi:hypothetical protein